MECTRGGQRRLEGGRRKLLEIEKSGPFVSQFYEQMQKPIINALRNNNVELIRQAVCHS